MKAEVAGDPGHFTRFEKLTEIQVELPEVLFTNGSPKRDALLPLLCLDPLTDLGLGP